MKRKNQESQKRRTRDTVALIFSVMGTVLLVTVIIVCIPLTIPRMFGYQVYTVITGSMEPEIPTGSLVYTKEIPPEEVEEDDVIAFYGSVDQRAIITHRVVSNQIVSGEIITKGDANEQPDPMPVFYDSVIGKVELSIPVIGRILALVASWTGKMIAIGMIVSSVLLHLLAGALRKSREE